MTGRDAAVSRDRAGLAADGLLAQLVGGAAADRSSPPAG
jgi:hypothetical protein